MRLSQFEVNNINDMRRGIARAKRISKSNHYSKIAFQIFTQLTDFEEIRALTEVIEQEMPWAMYYGCQTFGNIFHGRVSKKKTIVLFTAFEYETTKTRLLIVDKTSPDTPYKSLDDIWKFCNENSWVKGVEIISSYNAAESIGIDKPLNGLREDVQVFGGISINPENLMELDTYVFAKNIDFTKDAAIVVLLGGEDLHLKTSFVRGWEGLGKSFTITDCDGTKIKKIDDRPPIEIYKKYLDIDETENFQMKTIQFPLLVEVDGIECIRQPFRNDEEEGLSVLVGVEKGMKVRLSYGDDQTIIGAAKMAQPDAVDFTPECIRIYSCASRRSYLGDDNSTKEVSYFDDVAATAGFYTRGEILRVGDYLHYFNSTMVYVLAREGEKFTEEYYLEDSSRDVNEDLSMTPNLINYIGTVTNELEGQFMGAMSGMASIYKNLFILDMTNEELIQLDDFELAKKLLAQKDYYKDKFNYFIDNVVVNEYKDVAEMFCHIDSLSIRMKNRNVIFCDLVGVNVGWFRAQFVVINRDKDGKADRFVFTTQVIDDERKELEEKQRIIERLADTYFSIHIFDLVNDDCTEIDTVELLHNLYKEQKENGGQTIIHEAMKASCVPEHLDMMLEFTDFSTLPERMKDRKFLATDFNGSLKGWAKAQFIEYERDKNGNLIRVLFVTQIIDEEKRREQDLIRKSTIDELTGLPNRRAYEEALLEIRFDENKHSYVVCSLDVNGLKAVNDDIGHEAGDELLRGAAEVLSRCLGPYGKVYRIGGDEYNAIIYATAEEVKKIKEDLDLSMAEWKGQMVDSLSISYGFVLSEEMPDSSIDEIEAVADQRMYESKELYYRHGGVDRRSQQQIYETICKSYIKILSINLSDDSYKIIKTDESEMTEQRGYSDESLSKWLLSFVENGQIHEEDKDKFIEKTNMEYLRNYMLNADEDFLIRYRRKTDTGYSHVLMEITKTDKFTKDSMDAFLYVKKIGE